MEAGYKFLWIELFRQLEHHRVLRHESLFVTLTVQTVARALSIKIVDSIKSDSDFFADLNICGVLLLGRDEVLDRAGVKADQAPKLVVVGQVETVQQVGQVVSVVFAQTVVGRHRGKLVVELGLDMHGLRYNYLGQDQPSSQG